MVNAETLYCPLVAALDGLPARCRSSDIHVAVWSPHVLQGSPVISTSSRSSQDHPLQAEDEEEEEEEEYHQRVRQIGGWDCHGRGQFINIFLTKDRRNLH